MKNLSMALIIIGLLVMTATGYHSYATPASTMPETFESHEQIAQALSALEMRRTRLRLEVFGILGFIVFTGAGVCIEIFRRLNESEQSNQSGSKSE